MKTYLIGGLGNQMFQYAAGRAKALSRGETLTLNISKLLSPAPGDTPRSFTLDVFNIQAPISDEQVPIKNFTKKVIEKLLGKNDYFQNEKYFKHFEDIIRKDLTLKEPLSTPAQSVEKIIKATLCPISIHIRRGDYITNKNAATFHGTPTIEYYKKAVAFMLEKNPYSTFFVFSDDIEWVKTNLPIPNSSVFVSNPSIKDYEEIILMSLCKHHIIANSSFSWWGAWLNPRKDKIVIAPKKWFAKKHANPACRSWIKM